MLGSAAAIARRSSRTYGLTTSSSQKSSPLDAIGSAPSSPRQRIESSRLRGPSRYSILYQCWNCREFRASHAQKRARNARASAGAAPPCAGVSSRTADERENVTSASSTTIALWSSAEHASASTSATKARLIA